MSLETHQKIAELESIIERDLKFCARKSAIEEELKNADDVTGQIGFSKLQTLAAIEILERRILPDRHRRLQDKIHCLQANIKP